MSGIEEHRGEPEGPHSIPTDPHRWPSFQGVVACGLLAALALAGDAYFSAQEGYLSRPADYDGIGYMVFGRSAYLLLGGFHLHAGLSQLLTIAPGWNAALGFQFLILGAGTWQAFTVRFWAVALLLVLVYWIVRRRAPRSLAIAATVMTALLPLVSAGVRSSSWEFFSGRGDYYENFGLDDLRPDILAIALILWSIAILAEHNEAPGRQTYLLSAVFAAAAVLVKPSTLALLVLAWAATLAFTWFRNRRRYGTTRHTFLAGALFALLLAPWAIFDRGTANSLAVIEHIASYSGVYGTSDNLLERVAYFAVRIPTDLGQVEAWPVIAGALVATIALVRRRLGPAELIYAAVALLFYVVFAVATARNSHLPEWISLALWVFSWAGIARLTATRWPSPIQRATPRVLAAVGVYVLAIYALGAFALANWPANEQRSNAQLSQVTANLAQELRAHISTADCFTYAPGPGWPASIQFVLMDAQGKWPRSTATDIDLSTKTGDYVETAKQCAGVIAYRENITQVAQAFYAPVAYQPYLQAVADWVRSPGSGYYLDRSWSFSDLAPFGAHTLGHYQGVSLTVELYLRTAPT